MAFQPVPETAEAVLRFTINAQLCTLTFYGLFAVAYDQADLDDLALRMDTWAGLEFVPRLSDQAAYNGIEVRGLSFAMDLFASNSDSAGPGTAASPPLPNSVCFAVKRVTGFTGRSGRGRVYFPLVQGDLAADENFITTAAADATVDALDNVRVAMGGGGWTEVIVSRYTGGAQRVPFAVTIPVTNYEYADLEIDSQRRRMPSR